LTSLLEEYLPWPSTTDFEIGVHLSIAYSLAATDSDAKVVTASYGVVLLAA